jgi:hypothetical protein
MLYQYDSAKEQQHVRAPYYHRAGLHSHELLKSGDPYGNVDEGYGSGSEYYESGQHYGQPNHYNSPQYPHYGYY